MGEESLLRDEHAPISDQAPSDIVQAPIVKATGLRGHLSLVAAARELGAVRTEEGRHWCGCGATIQRPSVVDGRYTSAIALIDGEPRWECGPCLTKTRIDLDASTTEEATLERARRSYGSRGS